jgi:hypothetical protein
MFLRCLTSDQTESVFGAGASGIARQSAGKHLGTIMPPVGERAIAFSGVVPRRFQAVGDTTEHD